MIKEDFVYFELAKLLKEKGFNEPTWTRYEDNDEVIFGDKYNWNNSPMGQISAPTNQMAMKWLREVHNLFIELYVVKNYSKKKLEYTYSIQDLDFQGSDDGIECCKNWDTPEQACEIAIKYCLEKLI